jgi:hypothetical protein
MNHHFEGTKIYYLEKEAELFKCLNYLSKELSEQEKMTTEQLWEVFHICADTAAVYRHITDYFSTLDKSILDARLTNSKLKQELVELKHENNRLNKVLDNYIDDF